MLRQNRDVISTGDFTLPPWHRKFDPQDIQWDQGRVPRAGIAWPGNFENAKLAYIMLAAAAMLMVFKPAGRRSLSVRVSVLVRIWLVEPMNFYAVVSKQCFCQPSARLQNWSVWARYALPFFCFDFLGFWGPTFDDASPESRSGLKG